MRFRDSESALSAVVGTALVVAIVLVLAAASWIMFARLAEDKLSKDQVLVGFAPDQDARTARVIDFNRPLQWGTDLIVQGSCNPTLNGGNITGDVKAGDLLACANAGNLRVSSSTELGGTVVFRFDFE